jgi:hypothetical protein
VFLSALLLSLASLPPSILAPLRPPPLRCGGAAAIPQKERDTPHLKNEAVQALGEITSKSNPTAADFTYLLKKKYYTK